MLINRSVSGASEQPNILEELKQEGQMVNGSVEDCKEAEEE